VKRARARAFDIVAADPDLSGHPPCSRAPDAFERSIDWLFHDEVVAAREGIRLAPVPKGVRRLGYAARGALLEPRQTVVGPGPDLYAGAAPWGEALSRGARSRPGRAEPSGAHDDPREPPSDGRATGRDRRGRCPSIRHENDRTARRSTCPCRPPYDLESELDGSCRAWPRGALAPHGWTVALTAEGSSMPVIPYTGPLQAPGVRRHPVLLFREA